MPDESVRLAAWSYAFEKLGYVVTEDNRDSFNPAERAAWDAAVEEYLLEHNKSNGTE